MFRPCETDSPNRHKYCCQEHRDAANRENKRRLMKRWQAENAAHLAAYAAQWNAENRDKRRATEARYREKHREQIREYARRWHAADRNRRWEAKQRET